MSNLRRAIRNHIRVQGSSIAFDTIYPLELFLRGQDGYLWVELYDTSSSEMRLIDDSEAFGDTFAGKGCDAASIREKAAILVERSQYYAGRDR